MQTFEIAAIACQSPGLSTRSPDKRPETKLLRIAGDAVMLGVHPPDFLSPDQRDALVFPELRLMEEDLLERFFAGKIILRQRRAFVRRVGFGSDDADASCKVELAERRGGLDAAMAAADDEDVELPQFSASMIVALAMPPPSHMVCRPY